MSLIPDLLTMLQPVVMDGRSVGSPDQGNIGGWKPRTHLNRVIPVAGFVREFCAYSAQNKYLLQSV